MRRQSGGGSQEAPGGTQEAPEGPQGHQEAPRRQPGGTQICVCVCICANSITFATCFSKPEAPARSRAAFERSEVTTSA